MGIPAIDELYKSVREAADERVWTVAGDHDDGEEIRLRVKARGRPTPHEVYLWPGDEDWGCDCELGGDVCVHVCAAVIALTQARTEAPQPAQGEAATQARNAPAPLPQPKKQFQVRLIYAFAAVDNTLTVRRLVEWPDGRTEPLRGALAENDLLATRSDAQVESLLAHQPDGALSAEALRRLLVLMDPASRATLDGEPIRVSADPVMFRVRLTDEGEGFKVGLYRPRDIDVLYRGAALAGDVLRPTSHGDLTPDQKRLLVKGAVFQPSEVGRLVADYLPRLREYGGLQSYPSRTSASRSRSTRTACPTRRASSRASCSRSPSGRRAWRSAPTSSTAIPPSRRSRTACSRRRGR